MHDFSLSEELYDVVYVGVIRETEDVIIGNSCLLLGGEVLVQVAQRVPLRGYGHRIKGLARCGAGIYSRTVGDIVLIKASRLYLVGGEIARQLIYN